MKWVKRKNLSTSRILPEATAGLRKTGAQDTNRKVLGYQHTFRLKHNNSTERHMRSHVHVHGSSRLDMSSRSSYVSEANAFRLNELGRVEEGSCSQVVIEPASFHKRSKSDASLVSKRLAMLRIDKGNATLAIAEKPAKLGSGGSAQQLVFSGCQIGETKAESIRKSNWAKLRAQILEREDSHLQRELGELNYKPLPKEMDFSNYNACHGFLGANKSYIQELRRQVPQKNRSIHQIMTRNSVLSPFDPTKTFSTVDPVYSTADSLHKGRAPSHGLRYKPSQSLGKQSNHAAVTNIREKLTELTVSRAEVGMAFPTLCQQAVRMPANRLTRRELQHWRYLKEEGVHNYHSMLKAGNNGEEILSGLEGLYELHLGTNAHQAVTYATSMVEVALSRKISQLDTGSIGRYDTRPGSPTSSPETKLPDALESLPQTVFNLHHIKKKNRMRAGLVFGEPPRQQLAQPPQATVPSQTHRNSFSIVQSPRTLSASEGGEYSKVSLPQPQEKPLDKQQQLSLKRWKLLKCFLLYVVKNQLGEMVRDVTDFRFFSSPHGIPGSCEFFMAVKSDDEKKVKEVLAKPTLLTHTYDVVRFS